MSKVHPSKHISDIPPESLISQKSSAVLSLCVFHTQVIYHDRESARVTHSITTAQTATILHRR
ncbi:hypothetical protein QL093DRAFT_2395249 [Fusarium oxysporum]|nr:hypothetical protein QL093DRAFT_2395249 [Fusarium oxysporum]